MQPYPGIPAVQPAMQSFIDRGQISGCVTLIADAHHFLHISAQGKRDLARDLPMQLDTLFWIASMTKPVTAAAIMMARDQHKLAIDDPVSKFIPAFAKLKTPSGKPANLTLRHLLTHTSGLAETPRETKYSARTLADLIPAFLAEPMQFKPGEEWDYCQSGINTLGRIVEIVSGQSFPDFLQFRIFDPLRMIDTTFYPTPAQTGRLAVTYILKDQKLTPTVIALLPGPVGDRNHYPAANGGLFSTAADYSRFCQILLNNGTLDGQTLLSRGAVAEMTRDQTGSLPKVGFVPGSAWGLGFGIVREPIGITAALSPGTYGHGGAYGTQAWIDPARQRIHILLIQRADIENSDASEFRQRFHESAQ